MQYNAIKVRNVLIWIAVQLDAAAVHELWPVLYLAERRHLATTGEGMSGDTYVAMAHGPVPLRTYAELRLGASPWKPAGREPAIDDWLKQLIPASHAKDLGSAVSLQERDCLKWAFKESKRLGKAGLRQAVCGRAWLRASPEGVLDPLEMALEAGADAATLDHILRWRDGTA